MTSPSDASATCPRCGRALATADPVLGGICLHCAGKQVLNLDSVLEGNRAAGAETGEHIGPYTIIEELGRGGMGRVVAARQPGLGRVVAVKTVRAGLDPELDLRFLREIQTLSALRHPHIVAIHDSGRAADCLYFSMDYFEDGDLAARLRAGPLSPRETALLMHKVARALVHLHGRGVLHRDLKPSNILLDGPEPKLADFGLSTQLAAGGGLTALTRVLGTPHYLAPEALLGGSSAFSASGDIYSFGVVLYELLTGRTPFAGASPEGLLGLVRDSEPPAVRLLVPAVPRDLETICLKCLAREPAKRYATAAALEEDLARFQSGRPVLARPTSRLEQLARWARRRPHLAAVWLLVCVIAVGSLLAAVRIARERTRTETALIQANTANTLARERLRTARLAEAVAVVHTPKPGRRAQALAALAEAAALRPGVDLRDAALAALAAIDVEPLDTWDLQLPEPAEVAFSGDGRIAAIRRRASSAEGTDKHTLVLRERGRAEPLGTIQTPAAILGPVVLSSDGSRLAARLANASLHVWSTHPIASVLVLKNLPAPGDAARADQNADYSFAPSGKLLAVAHAGGGVDLVSLPGGNVVAAWSGPLVAQSVRYSPDGRWLAAARLEDPAGREVVLLDGRDARPAASLAATADVEGLVWSADSRRVGLVCFDSGCTWFTVPEGRRTQHANTTAEAAMGAAALAADDLLLLHPAGVALHLVDGNSGREELVFPGAGPSDAATINSAREFLTTSLTNEVTRWRPTPRPGWRVIPSARPPTTGSGIGPWAMDASPDGRWIATADGNHLVVQDTADGRPAAIVEVGPREFLYATVAFCADGSHLWRGATDSGFTAHSFTRSTDARSVVIGPAELLDAKPGFVIAAVSADRRALALLNPDTGAVKVLRVSAEGSTVESKTEWKVPGAYSAAFSPDANRVLVNCSGLGPEAATHRLCLYRTSDGKEERELPALARGEAAWSADGRTAMTSNGTDVSTLWNTDDWKPRCVLRGHLGGDATSFALATDGRTALIVRDGRAHLVSTTDGAVLITLELTDAASFCLGVQPLGAGRFAAVQLDGRLDLLDVAAWQAALAPLGLAW